MGGVSTPGGGDGNVELNLVPFIDLLSSLVLFLLLSAVWIQVASMKAAAESKGGRSTASSAPSKRLEVRLTQQGYKLTWPGGAAGNLPRSIAKKNNVFDDESLKATLAQISKSNVVGSAAVSSDEEIPYGAVVVTIDAIRSGGVASVAMSTN